jgi:hypothetical protein
VGAGRRGTSSVSAGAVTASVAANQTTARDEAAHLNDLRQKATRPAFMMMNHTMLHQQRQTI